MPKFRDTVIPLADYPDGTYQIPESVISNSAVAIDFKLQRCTTATPDIWPNTETTLSVDLEISLGPNNWQPYVKVEGVAGGILIFKGSELSEFSCGGTLPMDNNRRLRGTIVVSGGPLRTQGSIEITE